MLHDAKQILLKRLVKVFVGNVWLYRKSFIQRFCLKSDGADDAKPEAKKTLGKENTETFAIFKIEKFYMKTGTHQKPWITFNWIPAKHQKQPAKKCKKLQ